MDHGKENRSNSGILNKENKKRSKAFDIAIPSFLVQIPQRLQNCLKVSLFFQSLQSFDEYFHNIDCFFFFFLLVTFKEFYER